MWNDKTYTEVVAQHPALDTKPESVALAVWALKRNKNMEANDWRKLSKETGVPVLGRAVGSARSLLGMEPKVDKHKRRGPVKLGQTNTARAVGKDSLDTLLVSIRQVQKERDDAIRAMQKIRAEIDRLL
ncbi:MAG: hypothetical protein VYE77_12555 [Planctomycetota bacterium]|nr:hypothetical protein [Planctomycetota bacterium]